MLFWKCEAGYSALNSSLGGCDGLPCRKTVRSPPVPPPPLQYIISKWFYRITSRILGCKCDIKTSILIWVVLRVPDYPPSDPEPCFILCHLQIVRRGSASLLHGTFLFYIQFYDELPLIYLYNDEFMGVQNIEPFLN